MHKGGQAKDNLLRKRAKFVDRIAWFLLTITTTYLAYYTRNDIQLLMNFSGVAFFSFLLFAGHKIFWSYKENLHVPDRTRSSTTASA
jgi:hypothetical protein